MLALSSGFGESRAERDFRAYLRPYGVNVLDVVSYTSAIVPCYKCGRHQECKIGGAYEIWGEGVCTLEITPELFRRWEDHPSTGAHIESASGILAQSLEQPVRGNRQALQTSVLR